MLLEIFTHEVNSKSIDKITVTHKIKSYSSLINTEDTTSFTRCRETHDKKLEAQMIKELNGLVKTEDKIPFTGDKQTHDKKLEAQMIKGLYGFINTRDKASFTRCKETKDKRHELHMIKGHEVVTKELTASAVSVGGVLNLKGVEVQEISKTSATNQ